MIRHPDWEDRLATYLDRVADERFRWGTNDCALFASGAVNAMTGIDPAETFRGQYGDQTGARRALRELGEGTLLRTVTKWFGPPIPVALARRGDIVMLDATTCGVTTGRFSWFCGVGAAGERAEGLVALPTASCRYAFSVPFVAVRDE